MNLKRRYMWLFLLSIFSCMGCNKQVEENTKETEKVYAVASDMEEVFERLYRLIGCGFERKTITDHNGKIYGIYGDTLQSIDRISMDINEMKKVGEYPKTTYTIYVDEVEVYSFTVSYQYQFSATVFFKDVTQDGKEDLVISIASETRTYPTPELTYIYDMENQKEINLFNERGSLPEEQMKVLEEKIGEQLLTLFPTAELSTIRGWGRTFIDRYGNLYYHTYFKEKYAPNFAIGQLLILFDYDKEKEKFEISNIMCGWSDPAYLGRIQEEMDGFQ